MSKERITSVLNPRRAMRVPVRFAVEVRHRFSTWPADTEDLGPAGCQLVTPRGLSPGRRVNLAITCPPIGRTVRTEGTVVWTRLVAPTRLGVRFHALDAAWFEQLLATDPVARASAQRTRDRLPSAARLHLGTPPRHVVDFSTDELAVLGRVGDGVTMAALVASLGEAAERTIGAVFALLGAGRLVLDPAASPGRAAWERILDDPAETLASSLFGPRRPVAAQRLYDEALALLAAGRVAIAVRRIEEALRVAPGDVLIAAHLARLARWT